MQSIHSMPHTSMYVLVCAFRVRVHPYARSSIHTRTDTACFMHASTNGLNFPRVDSNGSAIFSLAPHLSSPARAPPHTLSLLSLGPPTFPLDLSLPPSSTSASTQSAPASPSTHEQARARTSTSQSSSAHPHAPLSEQTSARCSPHTALSSRPCARSPARVPPSSPQTKPPRSSSGRGMERTAGAG